MAPAANIQGNAAPRAWGTSPISGSILASIAGALVLGLLTCAGTAHAADDKRGDPEVIVADIAAIKRALAEARAQPGTRAVLINVWATWCEPCREEMPDLARLTRDPRARGVRLLLVSADASAERAAVSRFLAQQGIRARSYLKTGDDMEFIEGLDPGWDGTLPASWLFDRAGTRAHVWNGKISYPELIARIEDLPGHPPTRAKPTPTPTRRKP